MSGASNAQVYYDLYCGEEFTEIMQEVYGIQQLRRHEARFYLNYAENLECATAFETLFAENRILLQMALKRECCVEVQVSAVARQVIYSKRVME